MSTCDVCDQPTTQRCARCKSRSYCSKSCQANDWEARHAEECFLPPPPGRHLFSHQSDTAFVDSPVIHFPENTVVRIPPGTTRKFILQDFEEKYDMSVQSPYEAVTRIASTLCATLDFTTTDVCEIAKEFAIHESSVWKIAKELHHRWLQHHPYTSVTIIPAKLHQMAEPFCYRVFVEFSRKFHKKLHRAVLTCTKEFVAADTNNYVYLTNSGTQVNVLSTTPYPKRVLAKFLAAERNVLNLDWYNVLYSVLKRFMTKRVLLELCLKIALKAGDQLAVAVENVSVHIVFVHEEVKWSLETKALPEGVRLIMVDAKSFASEYENVVAK